MDRATNMPDPDQFSGKRFIFTQHSLKRLSSKRQAGIELSDVVAAAKSIPGYIVSPTRFRGFTSASGKHFDVVLCDLPYRRVIITVIGKE